MNESISTSYLVMMIAILISVISTLIITYFLYARAFKTKNKIVDIIEKYDGYTSEAGNEINQYLRDVGYTVMRRPNSCPDVDGRQDIVNDSSYAFCVYQYQTDRGYYYKVHVFANINLPIINNILVLRVKGQTRTIYEI